MMVFEGAPLFEYPMTRGEDPKALQVKVVPVTFEVRLMFVKILSQIDCVRIGFERSAVGKTVKTTSVESPGQLLVVGRMR